MREGIEVPEDEPIRQMGVRVEAIGRRGKLSDLSDFLFYLGYLRRRGFRSRGWRGSNVRKFNFNDATNKHFP